MAAKLLQSCPTLCDPIDGSPLGSTVPGILQAKTLEWVAISFSIAWKWKVKVKSPSHVQLFATPWTAAYQAPLSLGVSRQKYWSGVPGPSPKVLLGKRKFKSWDHDSQTSVRKYNMKRKKSYLPLVKPHETGCNSALLGDSSLRDTHISVYLVSRSPDVP